MKKYIVYSQKSPDDEDSDLGLRFLTEKVKECDTEREANECLATVRKSASYEYEWIQEAEN